MKGVRFCEFFITRGILVYLLMAFRKILLFIMLLNFGLEGFAQLSSDCVDATPIPTLIYNVPVLSYPTETFPNEVNPGFSCLSGGEINGLWYEFETSTAGILCFNFIQITPTDNFYWALYDLTNNPCSDIYTNPSLEVLCGISTFSSLTLPVSSGQVFKLLVRNDSATTNGYTLDFSCSTCSLNPNIGIPASNLTSQIKIGPNPTLGLLNLTINPGIVNEITSLKLVDLKGKTLISQSSGFASNVQLDLSNRPAGLYFLQISTSSEQRSIKIILE